MSEVVFISEAGVGIQIFGDPDVARRFAENMRHAGFDTLELDDETTELQREAS